MKLKLIVSALISAFVLTACGKVEATELPEITGTDYTFTPEASYIVKNQPVISQTMPEFCYAVYPTQEYVLEKSDEIVEGTIINVTYTNLGSLPWMLVDFVVQDSLNGELREGDAVSFYTMGGYMPMKLHYELANNLEAVAEIEDENALMYVQPQAGREFQIGENCLLFLQKVYDKENDRIVYGLASADGNSVYIPQEDGTYFSEIANEPWTREQIQEGLSKQKTE